MDVLLCKSDFSAARNSARGRSRDARATRAREARLPRALPPGAAATTLAPPTLHHQGVRRRRAWLWPPSWCRPSIYFDVYLNPVIDIRTKAGPVLLTRRVRLPSGVIAHKSPSISRLDTPASQEYDSGQR